MSLDKFLIKSEVRVGGSLAASGPLRLGEKDLERLLLRPIEGK
jgi:hypothetical protein